MSELSALILAKPVADDRVLVGVALGERGRRAAVLAGIAADRVHVVRDRDELEAAQTQILGEVIVVNATAQVVMPTLVEKLVVGSGRRAGYDPVRGEYAGIVRIAEAELDELWQTLAANFDHGDAVIAERGQATRVETAPIDRHPARDEAEFRAASTWIFQFVNKPLLDAPATKYLYRPMARPFTKLFVRLPFSPNMITIVSIVIGQIGCLIAARPGYWDHLIGIFLMAFVSGILDNVDGELARLRLQSSKLGAALDGVGDDLLRLSLLLALGIHCAPRFPELPIMWMSIGSVVFTILAMAPMYWYCVAYLKTWNIQNYNQVMGSSPAEPGAGSRGFVDVLVKVGGQIARRDFVDIATFVLAVFGIPIVAVVLFSIGSVAGFVTVIPAHLKAVRERA